MSQLTALSFARAEHSEELARAELDGLLAQLWIAPADEALCDAVQAQPAARVHGTVAGLTRTFIRIETQGFDLLET